MKKLILALGILPYSLAFSSTDYYGAKSTEATLSFNGKILLDTGLSTQAKREQIDEQLQHLIGHFQAATFLARYRTPGVLGQDYEVKLGRELRIAGQVEQSYTFEGRVNFHKDAFKRSDRTTVPLNLPYDLSTIYGLGVVRGKNRCTDDHYNSDGDFFYFWDPDKEGCPLQGNTTDVLRLEGKLAKLENTTSTYPEYDRIYQQETLRAAVFIGYIDRATNRDIGASTYRNLKNELKAMGLTLTSEDRAFQTLGGSEVSGGKSYRANFTGEVKTRLGTTQKIQLTLLLAESDMGLIDNTFHVNFVKALEEADLVAYDGHSGLGGNLSLDNLPPVNFKRQYQVYFFNGCSSYPYFNQHYFSAKPGGSRNLEIITAGLPTLTTTSESNMLSFLTPFLKGQLPSWQTIMNRMEASNGEEDTYLMGVNGDEDNQFRP